MEKKTGERASPDAKGGGTAEAVTEGLNPLQKQPLSRLAAPGQIVKQVQHFY